ncbi:hypothetical protein [Coxiella-like endosymbiont]|uniref:hypothetical protein n=1 Tax=Coxiella-like endosymbiont TaxID=1592897 RepID=UPI00272DB99E|nr:hypothetical protein [Coxiella-like endosymbiont]
MENFCKWLSEQAENLGVNIFLGFIASSRPLFNKEDAMVGVQTEGYKGLNKVGQSAEHYQPWLNLYAKQTLLAKG